MHSFVNRVYQSVKAFKSDLRFYARVLCVRVCVSVCVCVFVGISCSFITDRQVVGRVKARQAYKVAYSSLNDLSVFQMVCFSDQVVRPTNLLIIGLLLNIGYCHR